MTPADFALWLKGIVDVLGDEPPSAERWKRIAEQVQRISPHAGSPFKVFDFAPPWPVVGDPFTVTCSGREVF